MRVELLNTSNMWKAIRQATFNTIGKDTDSQPSSEWKRRLLLSEHSPIRKLKISWRWHDLMYWVSVHFVRHKIGIEHFISTQREDRTGLNRNEALQSAFVRHECEANAQAIINISRKRMCNCASADTREAWQEFLDKIHDTEPELYNCCVPECIYRGHCYEYKSCGFHKSKAFDIWLAEYRKGINE